MTINPLWTLHLPLDIEIGVLWKKDGLYKLSHLALASRTARAFENSRLKSSRDIIASLSRSTVMPRFDMKWPMSMFMLFRYDTSELMISNWACHSHQTPKIYYVYLRNARSIRHSWLLTVKLLFPVCVKNVNKQLWPHSYTMSQKQVDRFYFWTIFIIFFTV